MLHLKHLCDIVTGEPYLLEAGTGRRFRRTVCALAWPYGNALGCVIVLGELRAIPNILGARRHLHVLHELRSPRADELLDEAVRVRDSLLCPSVITPDDDHRVILFDEYNDRLRGARKLPLHLNSPVAWSGKGEGLLPYYVGLLMSRGAEEKSLYFGRDCSAGEEARHLGQADMGRKMIDMPGVCALCWAVEEIDQNPISDWGERAKLYGGPADELGGY